MKKLNFLFFLLLLLPQVIFSQESYTPLQTNSGEVKIPGEWQQLNTAEDSGQTYLKNSDNVIIAIAKNPKRAYPFYAKEKSDFENVTEKAQGGIIGTAFVKILLDNEDWEAKAENFIRDIKG